jgi:hypothetical protein
MSEKTIEEKFEIFYDIALKWQSLKRNIVEDTLSIKRNSDKYRKNVSMYKELTGKSLAILIGKIRRGELKIENI